MPIGKRPVPPVAGPRPKFSTKTNASYPGSRSSGAPMGPGGRPVPKVANSGSAKGSPKPGGGRRATSPMPMPAPKTRDSKRSTPKTR